MDRPQFPHPHPETTVESKEESLFKHLKLYFGHTFSTMLFKGDLDFFADFFDSLDWRAFRVGFRCLELRRTSGRTRRRRAGEAEEGRTTGTNRGSRGRWTREA